VGLRSKPLIVLNGGQAFVRRPSAERSVRDAKRIAKLLAKDTSFVLVGYDLSSSVDHALDRIIADLAQIIEQEFGPSKLVGISYGGIVGLRLAAAHAHLVTDLVLLASAHNFSAEGR
jgi:pimeloyl-ACP methyl ester carboxylesterase